MKHDKLNIETNQIQDVSTFPADAISKGTLTSGQPLTFVFKIDEKSTMILDCRWQSPAHVDEAKIIEFIVRLVVGLKKEDVLELQPDYIEQALAVLSVSHGIPLGQVLDILKSGLT